MEKYYTCGKGKGPYDDKWEMVKVPPPTYVLYVDTTMKYKWGLGSQSVVLDFNSNVGELTR